MSMPQEFGYVIGSVIVSGITVFMMGGPVMAARKRCEVPYPNMYASIVVVDGKEYTNAKDIKSAMEFNQTQRGHQNALETYPFILALAITGGLAHPRVASIGLLLWTIGAHFYSVQYRSQGATARNKGIAVSKYLGIITLLGLSGLAAFNNLMGK